MFDSLYYKNIKGNLRRKHFPCCSYKNPFFAAAEIKFLYFCILVLPCHYIMCTFYDEGVLILVYNMVTVTGNTVSLKSAKRVEGKRSHMVQNRQLCEVMDVFINLIVRILS